MTRFEFWSLITAAFSAVFSICIGLYTFWPKRPKLKIEVKDCSIEIGRFPAWSWGEKVQFTLVANNVGSKNCSVTSVKLKLPDGNFADLKTGKSTTLPLLVSTDKPEEIKMCGLCRERERLNDANDVPKRPDIFPKQDSVKTTILININTRTRPIKRLTTFAISRPERKIILTL